MSRALLLFVVIMPSCMPFHTPSMKKSSVVRRRRALSLVGGSVLLPRGAMAYGGLPERKGRIARTCAGSRAPECIPSPDSKTLSDLLDQQVAQEAAAQEAKFGGGDRAAQRAAENGPMQFHRGTEDRLVQRVLARATNGDAASVLAAVDEFCWGEHWKGAFVDAALRRAQPAVVVELGTYVGYSTVRWAAQLKDGARLWSIDPEPASQASASRLLRKAGLADRVTLLRGTAAEWIPKLSRELSGRPIDFLFIDHAKDEYLPDLKRIEEAGLLHAGSVVAADNVLVFGLDEYVDHVRRSGVYRESRTYTATLEYTEAGAADAMVDGVEISVVG